LALNRERNQEAYEAFNRALRCNEEDARAYHGIAEYYSQKGKRESAIDNYGKALKYYKDPERKNAIMNQLFKDGQTSD
jgi:Tfp pilus assembly protein PilF